VFWYLKIKSRIQEGILLQSIPFKNAVDVASNGERFTLANAANLKTYNPSKINTKKSHNSSLMMRLIQKLNKFDTNNQKIDQISKFEIGYQISRIALV
jgi:hypothetical protein